MTCWVCWIGLWSAASCCRLHVCAWLQFGGCADHLTCTLDRECMNLVSVCVESVYVHAPYCRRDRHVCDMR
jgi:hypothetical protein